MTIVYAGDTWTLEARLPYVVGETLTENSFSVLMRVGDKYALATPSAVNMTFTAPTVATEGSVKYTVNIDANFTQNTLHVACLMKELAAGFPGGHWNQTIATGNFTVKPRIVNSVVVGN